MKTKTIQLAFGALILPWALLTGTEESLDEGTNTDNVTPKQYNVD
jgi:hypothetical protein